MKSLIAQMFVLLHITFPYMWFVAFRLRISLARKVATFKRGLEDAFQVKQNLLAVSINKKQEAPLERASDFRSANPFFIVIMRASHATSNCHFVCFRCTTSCSSGLLD